MSHTLTVTRCEPDDDDIEYELQGPHDNSCAVWMPCCGDKPDLDDMLKEGDPYDERTWHDEVHKYIEGSWMTRTTICGGHESCDDLWLIARKLGLGSHAVDIEYYGDGSWRAVAADEAMAS